MRFILPLFALRVVWAANVSGEACYDLNGSQCRSESLCEWVNEEEGWECLPKENDEEPQQNAGGTVSGEACYDLNKNVCQSENLCEWVNEEEGWECLPKENDEEPQQNTGGTVSGEACYDLNKNVCQSESLCEWVNEVEGWECLPKEGDSNPSTGGDSDEPNNTGSNGCSSGGNDVGTGLDGMHDPTQLVALADGSLAVWFSGQGAAGNRQTGECGIAGRYLMPGTTEWASMGPMFGSCTRSVWPAWWHATEANTDADAPSVIYSVEPKFPGPPGASGLRNLVMYYSLYLTTPDMDREDDSGQACIGRATANFTMNDDPSKIRWTDDGKPVLCSNIALDGNGHPASKLYRNENAVGENIPAGYTYAIDPAIWLNYEGTKMYMAYGSGTILTVELDMSTGRINEDAAPGYTLQTKDHYQLASIGFGDMYNSKGDPTFFNEAPYVVRHNHGGTDYYYMFVNWFGCCAHAQSTYEIYVGRSKQPDRNFVDDKGRSLAKVVQTIRHEGEELDAAGGRKVLGNPAFGNKNIIGPGHAGVLQYVNKDGNGAEVFTFHYYDGAECGNAKLGMRALTWDSNGWPVIASEPWDPSSFMCPGGDADLQGAGSFLFSSRESTCGQHGEPSGDGETSGGGNGDESNEGDSSNKCQASKFRENSAKKVKKLCRKLVKSVRKAKKQVKKAQKKNKPNLGDLQANLAKTERESEDCEWYKTN